MTMCCLAAACHDGQDALGATKSAYKFLAGFHTASTLRRKADD